MLLLDQSMYKNPVRIQMFVLLPYSYIYSYINQHCDTILIAISKASILCDFEINLWLFLPLKRTALCKEKKIKNVEDLQNFP